MYRTGKVISAPTCQHDVLLPGLVRSEGEAMAGHEVSDALPSSSTRINKNTSSDKYNYSIHTNAQEILHECTVAAREATVQPHHSSQIHRNHVCDSIPLQIFLWKQTLRFCIDWVFDKEDDIDDKIDQSGLWLCQILSRVK